MSRPDEPTHDDDGLDWDEPSGGPDAEPTAAERAHARAFAETLDKVVAGRAPAAMAAEERPLVEIATVIRAVAGRAELTPTRRDAIVEAALARAIDGLHAGAGRTGEVAAARTGADVVPIVQGWRRRAPWLIAGAATALAAAAAVFLMLNAPGHAPGAPHRAGDVARLPLEQRSRAADALIGSIPRERSGDALSRIDAIFADRLDGYRARTLSGPQQETP